MKRKCNLIIDSCSDLGYDLLDVDGVDVMQFPYILDGKSFKDDMFESQSAHVFYEAMRKGAEPSTAQISVDELTAHFKSALASGIDTVYLSFGSALSGSYDTACMVAKNLCEECAKEGGVSAGGVSAGGDGANSGSDNNRVPELFVVDTMLPSLAEGLFVLEAIRQMNAGLTAEQLVKWADETKYYINAEFMVEDLSSLHRGGRIPAVAASAGGALDVKPLVTIDTVGALRLSGVSRGRKKGSRALERFYLQNRDENHESGSLVIVGHADCEKEADTLVENLKKADEDIVVIKGNIGPVIGSHVGPGMLAVVFWGQDRRAKTGVSEKIANMVKHS